MLSNKEDINFGSKFNDSVIQLIVFMTEHDIRRPFSEPIPTFAKGSAFIIDSKRAILLTNAHVVENIISVKGLAPQTNKDIRMRLISICREKDLAIVQVFKEDWDLLTEGKDPKSMEMEFEDTLHLTPMTPVVAVGYPLGQDNLKFTPGFVAGFETLGNDSSARDEEDFTETVSYIQTTAPTNPGNSGGPLINSETNKVVGVVSAGIEGAQNVGYAVSTRTIWSCLDKLMLPIIYMETPPLFADIQTSLIPPGGYMAYLGDNFNSNNFNSNNSKKNIITSPKSKKIATSPKSKKEIRLPNIIRLPQISLTYCRSSDDLSEYYAKKINKKSVKGIYVTKTQKDTVFYFLKEGFIISSFVFQSKENELIYADIDNGSKVTCTQYVVRKKSKDILELFSNDKKRNDNFIATPVERKFAFREVIDMVPLHASIVMNYVGENKDKWNLLTTKFNYIINTEFIPLQNCFLHFEPVEYEIISGLCLADLCMNHKDLVPESEQKYLKGIYKYEKHVIVTFVFPGSDVGETRSINIGDLIKSINDVEIHTISDVKQVLISNKNTPTLKIITLAGGILIINSIKVRQQDKEAILAYQIRDYNYNF